MDRPYRIGILAIHQTFDGELVPSTFTHYAIIPDYEDIKIYIAWLEHFYATHTKEQIIAIQKKDEKEWYKLSYPPADSTPEPKKRYPGYVYVLRADTGHYKIGYTKNVDSRVSLLGVEMPFDTELVYTYKTNDMKRFESSLHRRFQSKRIKGEWFALDEKDLKLLAYLEGKEIIYND